MKKLLLLFAASVVVLSCSKLKDKTCQETNEYVLGQLVNKKWDITYLPNGDTATFFPVFSSKGPNLIIISQNARVFEPFYFSNQNDSSLADVGTVEVIDCGHTLLFKTNLSGPSGLGFKIKYFTSSKIVTETQIPVGVNGSLVDTEVVLTNPRPLN